MECWAQNNWRTSQHGKSKGCDKQTDDFQASFPNFMTLTEEERLAFFQTLSAAKIKLENSGVTVKTFFGTIHDQSWNSDALDNKSSTQDDGYISRASKTPTQYQSNLSLDSFSPADSVTLIRSVSSGKTLKADESSGKFSQENLEVLGRNDSLESLGLGFEEKEVELTNFNGIFRNTMKIPNTNPVISSVSYEILNKGDGASIYQKQKEDALKIKGTKLKVQVTLTSGDNERMKNTSNKPKRVETNKLMAECLKQRSGKIFPKENKKNRCENVKFAQERIDDSEIKDLLNVEKESDEELPEEDEKLLFKIRKRSSESKRKKLEFQRNSDKAEGGKKEVEDQLSLKKETDSDKTLQERSETKILIRKEKPKKEQNDKEIVQNNTNVSTESLFTLKDDMKATSQSILAITTVKEGTGPSTKLEKQENEVAIKNPINRQAERQKRVEKLKKCLEKRELAYQKMMKRKNELKARGKEKSADLEDESTSKEEVKIEKNPISRNLKSEEETRSISEKKSVVVAHTEDTKEEEEKSAEIGATACPDPALVGDAVDSNPALFGDAVGSNSALIGDAAEAVAGSNSALIGDAAGAVAGSNSALIGDAAGAVAGSNSALIGVVAGAVAGSNSALIGDVAGAVAGSDLARVDDAAGAIESSGEEKALESMKDNLKDIRECATSFKPRKVVFVDDNVIEKIRNVIVDLEKQAKSEDRADNEYLVLLVDYVEYLSTVMTTLFEKRVTNPYEQNPNVSFDEENLKEIHQVLRASTSTTEDELESNEQLEIRKKRKKNKPRKTSFIKRLGKCFRGGKSKKNKKTGSSSSGSSS